MENSLMSTRHETNKAVAKNSRPSRGTRISKSRSLGIASVGQTRPLAQFAANEAKIESPSNSPRIKMYGVSFAATARIFFVSGASGFHLPVFSLLPKNTPYAVERTHISTALKVV